MASTREFRKIHLTEDDVPGAKIDKNNFDSCSNIQLKRWLECRGLKSAGNRSELLERCQDVVKAGKVNKIDINVDQGKWFQIKEEKVKTKSTSSSTSSESKNQPCLPPVLGWKPFPSKPIPSNFNYGHIYHYLLESVVLLGEDDKKEDTDLSHMTAKPLTKGEQYVKSGSVTNVMDCVNSKGNYFIKGKVDASMRNEQRIANVTISSVSGAILDASCTCPASALGRCNHVAALLLTLDKHCKENGYNPQSCTSKPCEWNQGKRKNKNPNKLTEAVYSSYKEKTTKLIDFDPRPKEKQHISPVQKNTFLSDLKYDTIQSGKGSMWSSLLNYQYEDYDIDDDHKDILKQQVWDFFITLRNESVQYGSDIYMIRDTESQSESEHWRSSRWFRITASTAKQANNLGQLVVNADHTDATKRKLYNFICYNVWSMCNITTQDMMYGVDNEERARLDYHQFLQRNNANAKVIKTGMWVNKLWPEIGCSPDGLVFDPEESQKYGLLEIKCLKLFRSVAPADLYQSLDDKKITNQQIYSACFARPVSSTDKLELKTTHMYYYQIQLQLAVTGLEWCDFVLWSPLGNPNVERIRKDDQLIQQMLGNITSLWHRVVAPEIFEMRVPRKLHPVILPS